MSVRVAEVACKSVLCKSGISDYAVNCYRGCAHACVYCYARFLMRFSAHEGERWGAFVDARTNAPAVLARELDRARPGRVMLSSVCDGWQPAEESYRLSRRCLELLVRYAFPIGILTKSGLVRRDLEVLRGAQAEVGVTLTTADEAVRRLIEPGASPVADRLDVLRRAREAGLRPYVFAGPIIPFLCDGRRELDALFRAIAAAGANYVLVDTLNPKRGLWPEVRAAVAAVAPQAVRNLGDTLYEAAARARYLAGLRRLALAAAARHGLAARLCF